MHLTNYTFNKSNPAFIPPSATPENHYACYNDNEQPSQSSETVSPSEGSENKEKGVLNEHAHKRTIGTALTQLQLDPAAFWTEIERTSSLSLSLSLSLSFSLSTHLYVCIVSFYMYIYIYTLISLCMFS